MTIAFRRVPGAAGLSHLNLRFDNGDKILAITFSALVAAGLLTRVQFCFKLSKGTSSTSV